MTTYNTPAPRPSQVPAQRRTCDLTVVSCPSSDRGTADSADVTLTDPRIKVPVPPARSPPLFLRSALDPKEGRTRSFPSPPGPRSLAARQCLVSSAPPNSWRRGLGARSGRGLTEAPGEGRQHLLGRPLLNLLDDLVDDAVLLRRERVEVQAAVGIPLQLVNRHTRHLGGDLEGGLAVVEHLARLDRNVRRLALRLLPPRLVQHHRPVRQRRALALLAAREQHRGEAVRLANEHGVDVRLDVHHGVGDRERLALKAHRHPVLRRRPRAVDVHRDGLLRGIVLQVQQLADDQLGHSVVDRHAEVDNAVVQQQRWHVRRRADASAVDHAAPPSGCTLRQHRYTGVSQLGDARA
mmetsp:Transcript_29332/g.50240  ORF Transcript_29332/g.50240 Transcript_29332/m.50240 type:complete len:351 (-) Transcript_29332:134-1186(-)